MPRMSTSNENDRRRTKLFTPKSNPQTDRLIEETEQLLINTRRFLEHLQAGEEATRKYVEGLKTTLENDLRRLERDRRESKKRS